MHYLQPSLELVQKQFALLPAELTEQIVKKLPAQLSIPERKSTFSALNLHFTDESWADFFDEFSEDLLENGLQIYISDHDVEDVDQCVLTILKAPSQFDIVEFEQTSAPKQNITTSGIIEQLKKWDTTYGLQIYAAGKDFLEFDLSELPADPLLFAEEIRTFCPDVIEYGFNTIEEFAESIEETSQVGFWWNHE